MQRVFLRQLSIGLLAAVWVIGAGAQAPMDHSKMGHPVPKTTASMALADGEVKKVDLQAQTVTLKHGPIKNIDMPAMTMLFKVANPALLTQAKVGDKVKFSADMPSGVLTLTRIELAK